MFHRWAALVLVLALCAMSPKNAAGQTQSQLPRGHGAGGLGQSYPNPFNPDTKIPFTVCESGSAGLSEVHVVSVRILNILAQPVVTPVLYGASDVSTTGMGSALAGQPIANLTLSCGAYTAYWNGKIASTGREAASGPYMVQISVDGKLVGTMKIFYAK
jgi:hypothetical protein